MCYIRMPYLLRNWKSYLYFPYPSLALSLFFSERVEKGSILNFFVSL